jgi:hypothetical protein
MRIRLFVRIGITDAERNDIPAFERARRRTLLNVADELRRFEPFFSDYASLLFQDLGPGDRNFIERHCRERLQNVHFTAQATYTDEDIQQSRFLELGINSKSWVDGDRDWYPFNAYSKRLCDECWYFDLSEVPDPYIIARQKSKKQLYAASNGIVIVAKPLWKQLEEILRPWARFGSVAYADSPREITDDLVWMMPTQLLGDYADLAVLRRCDSCGRRVHTAMGDPSDQVRSSMVILTEIPQTEAPIALPGSWYGEFRKGRPASVSWRPMVSRNFHEQLRKMKVRGFVPADRPVYTQGEAVRLLAVE